MENENPTFIPVFRKECTSCAHMVKHARQSFDECHFTKGNEDCPAKIIYIGVGVKNIDKAIDAIANSIINGDAAALQKFATKLMGHEPEETQKVLSGVRLAILNSYGIRIDDDGDFVMEDESVEDSDADDEEGEDDTGGDTGEEGEDSGDDEDDDDSVDEEDGEDEGADLGGFNMEALNAIIDDRILNGGAINALIDSRVTAILRERGVLAESTAPQSDVAAPVASATAQPQPAISADAATAAVAAADQAAPQTPAATDGDAESDDWNESPT